MKKGNALALCLALAAWLCLTGPVSAQQAPPTGDETRKPAPQQTTDQTAEQPASQTGTAATETTEAAAAESGQKVEGQKSETDAGDKTTEGEAADGKTKKKLVYKPPVVLFDAGKGTPKLRMGVGRTSLQMILANLSGLTLKEIGVSVEAKLGVDPEVVRYAMMADRLDLAWDYPGQALIVYLRNPDRDLLRSGPDGFEAVRKADLPRGLTWSKPAPVNNTYAVLVPNRLAKEAKLQTITDLANWARPRLAQKARETAAQAANQAASGAASAPSAAETTAAVFSASGWPLKMAVDNDFWGRPDGFRTMASLFSLSFTDTDLIKLDPALVLQTLGKREACAGVGPRIDSRLRLFQLTPLEADKPFFPAYNPAVVWRTSTAKGRTNAVRALDKLSALLTEKDLNRMLYDIEIDHQDVFLVCGQWLHQSGLIAAVPEPLPKKTESSDVVIRPSDAPAVQ